MKLVKHHSSEGLNLNPGFYTKKSYRTHNDLQKCIDQSFAKFKKKLGKSFGMTLVDLTGDKLEKPHFAQYNSYRSMYGASQSKVASIIAAHQMLFDLRKISQDYESMGLKKIEQEAKVLLGQNHPNFKINDKFKLTLNSGKAHVDFTLNFKKEMSQSIRQSNNVMATSVIHKVGFNYINSVLWQMGLYDPIRGGGLWLGRSYGKPPLVRAWHRSPIGNFSHGVNAISMAKFLTLMTQERLISPQASKSIKDFLSDTIWSIKFIQGLKNMGLKVNKDGGSVSDPTKKVLVYRKSGSMGKPAPVSHDGALIYRTVCKEKLCLNKVNLRYVATAVSKGHATKSMPTFIQKMDYCIRKNNQAVL